MRLGSWLLSLIVLWPGAVIGHHCYIVEDRYLCGAGDEDLSNEDDWPPRFSDEERSTDDDDRPPRLLDDLLALQDRDFDDYDKDILLQSIMEALTRLASSSEDESQSWWSLKRFTDPLKGFNVHRLEGLKDMVVTTLQDETFQKKALTLVVPALLPQIPVLGNLFSGPTGWAALGASMAFDIYNSHIADSSSEAGSGDNHPGYDRLLTTLSSVLQETLSGSSTVNKGSFIDNMKALLTRSTKTQGTGAKRSGSQPQKAKGAQQHKAKGAQQPKKKKHTQQKGGK